MLQLFFRICIFRNRRSEIGFASLIILFLLGTNRMIAQVTPPPSAGKYLEFFTLKDSTFEKWVHVAGCSFTKAINQMVVDATGNLYGLTLGAAEKHPYMLTDHGWVSWDKGINEKINYLYADGLGIVYAQADKSLYLLNDSVWSKIVTIESGNMPRPQVDGHIYNVRDAAGGSDTWGADKVQLMTFAEGKYQPLGAGGKPLFLKGTRDRFIVDRNGKIYSYQDHEYDYPQMSVELYQYQDGKWKTIGTLPTDIDDIGFDLASNLYAEGYDKEYGSYVKKWNGTQWEDIYPPAGVEIHSGMDIYFDEKGQLYTEGYDRANLVDVIFRQENGNWVEIAREDPNTDIDKWIPTSKYIYGYSESKGRLDRYYGHWDYNQMEVANILLPAGLDENFEKYYSIIRQYYIFRKGDKLGVQDKKGRIMVNPVFDKIEVVRMPLQFPALLAGEKERGFNDYSLQLTSGNELVQVSITDFTYWAESYPQVLLGFKSRTTKKCSYCDGSGTAPDRQKEVITRGKWIPEKTVQTSSSENVHYDINSGGWRNVRTVYTKTIPGHYEPDTKSTMTVPGGPCLDCAGKGVFREYEVWKFDNESQKYLRGWR